MMLINYINLHINIIIQIKNEYNDVNIITLVNIFLITFQKIKQRCFFMRLVKSKNDYNKLLRRFEIIKEMISFIRDNNQVEKNNLITNSKMEFEEESREEIDQTNFIVSQIEIEQDMIKLSRALGEASNIINNIKIYDEIDLQLARVPERNRENDQEYKILMEKNHDKKIETIDRMNTWHNTNDPLTFIRFHRCGHNKSWSINIKLVEIALNEKLHLIHNLSTSENMYKCIHNEITNSSVHLITLLEQQQVRGENLQTNSLYTTANRLSDQYIPNND